MLTRGPQEHVSNFGWMAELWGTIFGWSIRLWNTFLEGKAMHYKFWMEGELVGEHFEFKHPLPNTIKHTSLSDGPDILYAVVTNLATSCMETNPFHTCGPFGVKSGFCSNPD
jgi:hypothetical protein